CELLLELLHALPERIADALKDGGESLRQCHRRGIRSMLRPQALASLGTLGALALDPLHLAPLGRQLPLQLGFPDCQRSLGRGAASLLDKPRRAPLRPRAGGIAAVGLAHTRSAPRARP